MLSKAVVGLKPDLENEKLLNLTRSVLAPDGAMHLVSFVQVGVNEDELSRLEKTKEQIEKTAAGLRSEGYDVDTEVSVTSVGMGNGLARIAERVEADVLVIGLAKRSRVGKALLGSDAQSAIMHSTCAVLAVHLD